MEKQENGCASDLIRLCDLIARGEYGVAKELFALTIEGAALDNTAALAESFGMMLVKVEAREFQLEKVIAELNRALEELARREHSLASENALLKSSLRPGGKKRIVAESTVMQNLLREARRIAKADSTVLISGETGSGKTMLAMEMHAGSRRAAGPFVSINCAGIPPSLFESELFGIEKGVATGVEARIGRFEQANGGTLFLDEIGDMPLESQAKILHVMDSGSVERVGGRKSIPVNVRIIAATHHDLQAACEKKLFRSDLFYRLNVISLHLPPLRERKEDIGLMAVSCLLESKRLNQTLPSGVSEEALQILRAYPWPGNIRELANEMERASLLAREELVRPDDLSAKLLQPSLAAPPAPDFETPEYALAAREMATDARVQRQLEGAQNLQREAALEAAEIDLIRKALAQTRGNKSRAARILGLSREGLRKKLKRLGIED